MRTRHLKEYDQSTVIESHTQWCLTVVSDVLDLYSYVWYIYTLSFELSPVYWSTSHWHQSWALLISAMRARWVQTPADNLSEWPEGIDTGYSCMHYITHGYFRVHYIYIIYILYTCMYVLSNQYHTWMWICLY